MTPFLHGFADELVKLGSAGHGVSSKDVVLAEAGGPIASMVQGYKSGRKRSDGSIGHGLREGAKRGLAYGVGGGGGALVGVGLAKLIEKAVGHDPGVGMLRPGIILPAVGGVLGGLAAVKYISR